MSSWKTWAASKFSGLYSRLRRLFSRLGEDTVRYSRPRPTIRPRPDSVGLSQVGVVEELRHVPPASSLTYSVVSAAAVWNNTGAHPPPAASADPPKPPTTAPPHASRAWQQDSLEVRRCKAWADPYPEVRYFRLTEEEVPLVDTASTSSSSGLGSEEEAS